MCIRDPSIFLTVKAPADPQRVLGGHKQSDKVDLSWLALNIAGCQTVEVSDMRSKSHITLPQWLSSVVSPLLHFFKSAGRD